jgi:hypothetical protein
MAIAFGAGFVGVFVPALLQILDSLTAGDEVGWSRTLLISLIAGAFAAGIRGALAVSPINLSPTDKLTTLKDPAKSVTISREDAPS